MKQAKRAASRRRANAEAPAIPAPYPQGPGSYSRIHAVVRRIPRGRVATYGQVAELAGLGGHARQVGYALAALSEGSALPWQRVVNARGEVSPRRVSGWEGVQRALLEREGIAFDARGRIDLSDRLWRPRSRARRNEKLARRPKTRRGRA